MKYFSTQKKVIRLRLCTLKNVVFAEFLPNISLATMILLALALALRFYNFDAKIYWLADTGRDHLAAELIAHEGARPTKGHWNSGLGISYPPTYYYILASFTYFLSFYQVHMLYTLLHVIGIFIFYMACARFMSKHEKLLLLMFLSLHPYLVVISHYMISAYFSVIIFYIGYYFYVDFYLKQKLRSLILSMFFLAVILSIFFGGVLFIPAVIVSTFLMPKNAIKQKVMYMFVALLSFGIFSLILYWNNLWSIDVTETVRLILSRVGGSSVDLELFTFRIAQHLDRLFVLHRSFVLLILFLLLLISRKDKLSWGLLGMIGYMYFLYGTMDSVLFHYLVFSYIIWMLLVSRLIGSVRKVTLLFLALVVLIGTSFHMFDTLKVEDGGTSHSHHISLKIAELVNRDYPDYYFFLSDTQTYDFWKSREIWLFLKRNDDFEVEGNTDVGYRYDLQKTGALYICVDYSVIEYAWCHGFATENQLLFIDKLIIGDTYFTIYESDSKIN